MIKANLYGQLLVRNYCESAYQNIAILLDACAFSNWMQSLSLINLCRQEGVHLAAYAQRPPKQ